MASENTLPVTARTNQLHTFFKSPITQGGLLFINIIALTAAVMILYGALSGKMIKGFSWLNMPTPSLGLAVGAPSSAIFTATAATLIVLLSKKKKSDSLPFSERKKEVPVKENAKGVPVKENAGNQENRFAKVPTKASDIPVTWAIPNKGSETAWLGDQGHIPRYMDYLELQYPERNIGVFNESHINFRDKDPFVHLRENLFEQIKKEHSNYNQLNIPFCIWINKHYVFVYIDRKKRTVEYYDSMVNYVDSSRVKRELTEIANRLTEEDPGATSYKFESKITKKLQRNGYQCAIWVLYFLECKYIDPEFDFNTLDVKDAEEMMIIFRQKVIINRLKFTEAVPRAQREESAAYLEAFGNKEFAQGMLATDLGKLSNRERTRQVLSGDFMRPDPEDVAIWKLRWSGQLMTPEQFDQWELLEDKVK